MSSGQRGAGWRSGGAKVRRLGYRNRGSRIEAAPPLPAFRPIRFFHLASVRWNRTRPFDRPTLGRNDGRKAGRRERGGKRIDILVYRSLSATTECSSSKAAFAA